MTISKEERARLAAAEWSDRNLSRVCKDYDGQFAFASGYLAAMHEAEARTERAEAGLRREFDKGFMEGESKQAIIEVQARERFLAEISAPEETTRQRDRAIAAEADRDRLAAKLTHAEQTNAALEVEVKRYAAAADRAEAERDEARREVCELKTSPKVLRYRNTLREYARYRCWDCFDEEPGE